MIEWKEARYTSPGGRSWEPSRSLEDVKTIITH